MFYQYDACMQAYANTRRIEIEPIEFHNKFVLLRVIKEINLFLYSIKFPPLNLSIRYARLQRPARATFKSALTKGGTGAASFSFKCI